MFGESCVQGARPSPELGFGVYARMGLWRLFLNVNVTVKPIWTFAPKCKPWPHLPPAYGEVLFGGETGPLIHLRPSAAWNERAVPASRPAPAAVTWDAQNNRTPARAIVEPMPDCTKRLLTITETARQDRPHCLLLDQYSSFGFPAQSMRRCLCASDRAEPCSKARLGA